MTTKASKKPAVAAGSLQCELLGKHDATAAPNGAQDDGRAGRRRFLIAALMAGWIRPERVVERVVTEIQSEAAFTD
jgi:hypothetical protein